MALNFVSSSGFRMSRLATLAPSRISAASVASLPFFSRRSTSDGMEPSPSRALERALNEGGPRTNSEFAGVDAPEPGGLHHNRPSTLRRTWADHVVMDRQCNTEMTWHNSTIRDDEP